MKRIETFIESPNDAYCPACGHHATKHPFRDGHRVCSRVLNELPSCEDCAAPVRRLRAIRPEG